MIIGTTKEEADFLREMRFIDDYPQLMETLNKPRFTIKDIGVTPRDATYWDQQKAFPKLKTEGSSRRLYSLSQAIWIKFIQQMRGHGIPLKKIVEYKSDILGDELDVKALFEDQEALSKMKELFKNSDKAEEFEQMIEDPEFGSILEGIQLSIFEMLILLSIVVKKSYGYIVPINDEIFPYCFDQHQQFIKHKEHLFIVVNDYGATTGIITLEDCIEALLGEEIIDELDYDKSNDFHLEHDMDSGKFIIKRAKEQED